MRLKKTFRDAIMTLIKVYILKSENCPSLPPQNPFLLLATRTLDIRMLPEKLKKK